MSAPPADEALRVIASSARSLAYVSGRGIWESLTIVAVNKEHA